MRAVALIVLLGLTAVPLSAQTPDAAVQRILDMPQFKHATDFFASDYERFVRELITLTEIPAPPFKEERRARAFMRMLRRERLSDVQIDEEGNVLGVRKGRPGGQMAAVVAHLDTVFPETADVKVKRDGTRLMAPGIGDDTRGLALMLAVIRALNAARFQTSMDILFVASVGEEGEGDLRGVKHLLRNGRYKERIKQFIAIDGTDQGTITIAGVGSRRYRVAFTGPGGHSYGAFGLVSPAYAMAAAIARLSRVQVPPSPKTTFNVGVVSGGTSVNSIPSETQMDVDIRSESCTELKKLDEALAGILKEAVEEENRARSTREGRVSATPKLIGDRPCGETAPDTPIVQTAAAVVRAFGLTPVYATSSTDANIAMSLGIPAVTIGRGPGGRAHSPDEWTDVNRPGAIQAAQVALAVILGVAGVL